MVLAYPVATAPGTDSIVAIAYLNGCGLPQVCECGLKGFHLWIKRMRRPEAPVRMRILRVLNRYPD